MKLSDIYKHKVDNSIIQINSFAKRINTLEKSIIVFTRIENTSMGVCSMPSFNGYGTKEEIELEYDLFISQEDLEKYDDWNEIFNLAEERR